MWEFIAGLLGAGKGFLGTVIRNALAGVGGWLVGYGVTAEVALNFQEALVGLIMVILSVFGSIANNKANKERAEKEA